MFVSGANSFFWHHGKTSSIIYETPSITTTYLVSTTDQYGCSKTDSVIVNVINPSEGFNYGSDSVFCKIDTTILPTILVTDMYLHQLAYLL